MDETRGSKRKRDYENPCNDDAQWSNVCAAHLEFNTAMSNGREVKKTGKIAFLNVLSNGLNGETFACVNDKKQFVVKVMFTLITPKDGEDDQALSTRDPTFWKEVDFLKLLGQVHIDWTGVNPGTVSKYDVEMVNHGREVEWANASTPLGPEFKWAGYCSRGDEFINKSKVIAMEFINGETLFSYLAKYIEEVFDGETKPKVGGQTVVSHLDKYTEEMFGGRTEPKKKVIGGYVWSFLSTFGDAIISVLLRLAHGYRTIHDDLHDKNVMIEEITRGTFKNEGVGCGCFMGLEKGQFYRIKVIDTGMCHFSNFRVQPGYTLDDDEFVDFDNFSKDFFNKALSLIKTTICDLGLVDGFGRSCLQWIHMWLCIERAIIIHKSREPCLITTEREWEPSIFLDEVESFVYSKEVVDIDDKDFIELKKTVTAMNEENMLDMAELYIKHGMVTRTQPENLAFVPHSDVRCFRDLIPGWI